MDTEDGELFIKHLAYYIRTHEKALANSLYSQRQAKKRTSTGDPKSSLATKGSADAHAPGSSSSNSLLSRLNLNRGPPRPKTPKLFLTPNQLYYLLTRFEELEVKTGPLNIRLENIHSDFPSSNYVSFMSHTQVPKIRNSDADSLHSVSSTRSVVPSFSDMLASLSFTGKSTAKVEKQLAIAREDLRYVYSSFTKIPCVKLAIDQRLRRIAGFEEFPFDTAVPIHAFKNLTHFELSDIDFRSVFGWDQLADQLRSLVITRASFDDMELLTTIVLDDMDGRRRRSSKSQCTTPLFLRGNTGFQQSDDFFSSVSPDHAKPLGPSSSSPKNRGGTPSDALQQPRNRASSAHRRSPSRRDSTRSMSRLPENKRRTSSASESRPAPATPRGRSSSNLLLPTTLPSNKWRFLRHLSVVDNGLTAIGEDSLKPFSNSLCSLDISSNLFSEIPDTLSTLANLTSLNMSNCMIESLRSLKRKPLSALTVLNLRANRFSSMAGIEVLTSLQRLDIMENRLTDPYELARLTDMAKLQDVHLRRNPFTRSHANYRLTIFNIFRSTPGSSRDITIDSTGPGYAERRHLVDRAPEAEQRPIKEELLDGELAVTTTDQQADRATQGTGVAPDDQQAPNLEDGAVQPSKKRKQPRRRIVDLSDAATPQTPTSTASAQSDRIYMTAKEQQNKETNRQARPEDVDMDTPITRSRSEAPDQEEAMATNSAEARTARHANSPVIRPTANQPVEGISQSNDLYRRRIQALKSESTNAWLTPLETKQTEPNTAHSAFDIVRDRPMAAAERA